MNECTLLEFKINDDYIDNPPLPKSELIKYDFDYCYEKLIELIEKFVVLQIEYPNVKRPTITQNYEIRYEQFLPKKIDKTGKYVINKISKEEDIIALYSDIVSALRVLSKDEFSYFLECIYYRKSNNEFIRKTNYSRHNLNNLRLSCVIKLAKNLDIAKQV